jgi:hypothetical protein
LQAIYLNRIPSSRENRYPQKIAMAARSTPSFALLLISPKRHRSHQAHRHRPKLALEGVEDQFQRLQRGRAEQIAVAFFAEDDRGRPADAAILPIRIADPPLDDRSVR